MSQVTPLQAQARLTTARSSLSAPVELRPAELRHASQLALRAAPTGLTTEFRSHIELEASSQAAAVPMQLRHFRVQPLSPSSLLSAETPPSSGVHDLPGFRRGPLSPIQPPGVETSPTSGVRDLPGFCRGPFRLFNRWTWGPSQFQAYTNCLDFVVGLFAYSVAGCGDLSKFRRTRLA